VRISAKSDYALRALLLLAERAPTLITLDSLTVNGAMPRKFLEGILGELRRTGLVQTRRGVDGGYTLALPARRITIGEVIRAMDGPIVEIPIGRVMPGTHTASIHLETVWLAMSASLATVLDQVTIEHVLTGRLPTHVRRLSAATGQSALPVVGSPEVRQARKPPITSLASTPRSRSAAAARLEL